MVAPESPALTAARREAARAPCLRATDGGVGSPAAVAAGTGRTPRRDPAPPGPARRPLRQGPVHIRRAPGRTDGSVAAGGRHTDSGEEGPGAGARRGRTGGSAPGHRRRASGTPGAPPIAIA